MITYFDTSSLLKLVIDEDGSERIELIWDNADTIVSSALIVVESRAALASARRARRITTSQYQSALNEVTALIDEISIVNVTEILIDHAAQLAEEEGLRGYDAVHLAAALAVHATVFSSADTALCDAAERRGLHVTNLLKP